jgi:tRNA pseudouridine13 synthase
LSWLTADLPGTGGVYKEHPEDFQVEEIPLYPCAGRGEHLYLWIEKAGISTRELLAQLSKGLQLKEREIGYAGLKDARARTRQMISVPARCSERLGSLQLRKARILQQDLHGNKLRLGHLAGNRFTIKLRDTHPEAAKRAAAILKVLETTGVPNRFGEQRYGILGNSAKLGLLLLQENYVELCREQLGDPEIIRNGEWRAAAMAYRQDHLADCLKLLPRRMRDERRLIRGLLEGKKHRDAVFTLPRNLLRLYLSACQSQLFDRLLEQRLPNLHKLNVGDIAYKHDNGACFRVEDTSVEQARADRFEISPTAPLFGYKVMLATGQPGEAEQQLLAATGLSIESWQKGRGLAMPGERRPLRVSLRHPEITEDIDNILTLCFSLPRGSYATSVLHEIIK